MSTKLIFPCALVLAALGIRAAHAQDLMPSPTRLDTAVSVGPPATEATQAPAAAPASPPPTLSSWLAYPRVDCCGPIGGNGPIQMELFTRTGPVLPAAGPIFGHVLETGWRVEGGGRSLFFDPAMDAAWTIDLSISNDHFQGQRSDIIIPLHLPVVSSTGTLTNQLTNVSARVLNLTDVNVAFGREWYLRAPANVCSARWRVGFDAGPHLGSAKAEFHEIPHRTDVEYGFFAALHTDLEIPCNCCTFLVGFRTEWAYDWMDILQSSSQSSLQEVMFLLTFGVRF